MYFDPLTSTLAVPPVPRKTGNLDISDIDGTTVSRIFRSTRHSNPVNPNYDLSFTKVEFVPPPPPPERYKTNDVSDIPGANPKSHYIGKERPLDKTAEYEPKLYEQRMMYREGPLHDPLDVSDIVKKERLRERETVNPLNPVYHVYGETIGSEDMFHTKKYSDVKEKKLNSLDITDIEGATPNPYCINLPASIKNRVKAKPAPAPIYDFKQIGVNLNTHKERKSMFDRGLVDGASRPPWALMTDSDGTNATVKPDDKHKGHAADRNTKKDMGVQVEPDYAHMRVRPPPPKPSPEVEEPKMIESAVTKSGGVCMFADKVDMNALPFSKQTLQPSEHKPNTSLRNNEDSMRRSLAKLSMSKQHPTTATTTTPNVNRRASVSSIKSGASTSSVSIREQRKMKEMQDEIASVRALQ